MRRPWLRQVVFDTSRFQTLLVVLAAIDAMPVQRLRLAAWPPRRPLDGWDIVEQRQRLASIGAVGSGDADGQWSAVAIDDDVAFAPFLSPIRGIFAGKYPPKQRGLTGYQRRLCPSRSAPRGPGGPARRAGAFSKRHGVASIAGDASR